MLRKIKLIIKSRLVWWRAKARFYRYWYRKDLRNLKKVFASQESPGKNRACFVFSTKNRAKFTLKSLESMDYSRGFDVVWIDGSDTKESLDLFRNFRPKNFNILHRIGNVRGGPDVVILLGLSLLLRSRYEYLGLIENDVYFVGDWFPALLQLFEIDVRAEKAERVGAASLRNYKARNLKVYDNYSLSWNLGAGMILFSREAALRVLEGFGFIFSAKLKNFYYRKFGIDVSKTKDPLYPGMFEEDFPLSGDSKFCYNLWKNNLACVASVPSRAHNMDEELSEIYL
jgi:hypothetical protein